MAFQDLREFLDLLMNRGELSRVSKEVNPRYELSAICRKLIAMEGPAVLFENVRGSDIPVVSDILATRRKVALALGCDEASLLTTWLERSGKQISPERVKSGPCKDVIHEKMDLMHFPVPIYWNEKDGGPYITFALFICKNPKDGRRNVAIYRLQIKGKNKIAININPPHQHGGICYRLAEEKGLPLECVLAIGVDPVCYLASQAPLDFGDDEFALASSLRQDPIRLVPCETVDLEVPATAELVIEGRVLPQVREPEGPFGEWTGYVSGQADRPIIEVSCMSHRKNPIYCVAYEGYPTAGTSTVTHAVTREPVWFDRIQKLTCPTIKDIHFTAGGVGALHVVVSIIKQAEGQAKNVILDLLRNHPVKHVVVVDEDIDVRNLRMVEWAVATRVQADKDVIVIPGMSGMRLDPSQPAFPSGTGTKMGIDATKPLGKQFPEVARVPDEVMDRVERDWQEYGL